MKITYVHASRFGNGAKVAGAFAERMATRGVEVDVRHVDDVRAMELPPADLYVFSSPGRMGKPVRSMRRFLKELRLPAGTRYALLTTEMAPRPDRKTGRLPTEKEICRFQRIRPIMHELLRAGGLTAVAEEKVYVTDIKGPLEAGWEEKVATYTDRIPDVAGAVTPS